MVYLRVGEREACWVVYLRVYERGRHAGCCTWVWREGGICRVGIPSHTPRVGREDIQHFSQYTSPCSRVHRCMSRYRPWCRHPARCRDDRAWGSLRENPTGGREEYTSGS